MPKERLRAGVAHHEPTPAVEGETVAEPELIRKPEAAPEEEAEAGKKPKEKGEKEKEKGKEKGKE